MSKIKKKVKSVDENVEQLKLSYTVYGNIKLYHHFGRYLAVS